MWWAGSSSSCGCCRHVGAGLTPAHRPHPDAPPRHPARADPPPPGSAVFRETLAKQCCHRPRRRRHAGESTIVPHLSDAVMRPNSKKRNKSVPTSSEVTRGMRAYYVPARGHGIHGTFVCHRHTTWWRSGHVGIQYSTVYTVLLVHKVAGSRLLLPASISFSASTGYSYMM